MKTVNDVLIQSLQGYIDYYLNVKTINQQVYEKNLLSFLYYNAEHLDGRL
jgi:hypothetical protein